MRGRKSQTNPLDLILNCRHSENVFRCHPISSSRGSPCWSRSSKLSGASSATAEDEKNSLLANRTGGVGERAISSPAKTRDGTALRLLQLSYHWHVRYHDHQSSIMQKTLRILIPLGHKNGPTGGNMPPCSIQIVLFCRITSLAIA
jgi:hypothetical protein